MRQHSCHRAAAWSAAGALADGNGRRAGRSRACRASSRAIRRLPRCAAPSTSNWHTRHASLPGRQRPSLRRWLARERRRRRSAPPAAAQRVEPEAAPRASVACERLRRGSLTSVRTLPSLGSLNGSAARPALAGPPGAGGLHALERGACAAQVPTREAVVPERQRARAKGGLDFPRALQHPHPTRIDSTSPGNYRYL
eukprot:scaffold27647_cov27-Phaeocystis_antarctica.AAC.1